MKKIAKLLFASAALLTAFVSCQKVEEISEAPKTTHIVRFTTEMPTKTSYTVEGTTVNYKWEESDLYRLHVYEDGVEGTIIVDESAIDETYVRLTVSFEGEDGNSHTYTANLNGGVVKSEQVADGKYDSDCDVLVAKPVSSEEITDGIYTFQFRRPVAITELKLKGLEAEKKVSKVTIISDSGHPIAGKYTQDSGDNSTGEWSESSNKIVVTFGTEQDGTTPKTKTVGSDGILPLSIVTCPIKEASVKVLIETTDGKKYRKVTTSALTLLADVVKAQGIGLNPVTEAVHTDAGWYLVTDASELFDGDEIRIASPANSAIAGALGGEKYLAKNNASFTPETYNQLTGTDSENAPETFTLVEKYSAPDGVLAFELVSSNGKLGTTAVKTMSYDDGLTEYKGVTEWTIAIDNKLASIGAGSYGRIQYNVTSPRFVNYTSDPQSNQVLPWIYKKYGDASEPILKKTRTASFSPETATVTIDANDNVFPTLSFNPEDAKDGDQTWTSSNTDVATVNATTGEVTLVSDGTTTISVEIAETETYQPCSAEYVLTVNPAAEEGVDLLKLEWTGVEAKATYADWSNKVGDKSGNTYAGNSAGDKNSIQLRTNKSNSGIVVTSSASNQVAKKITVDWNTETASERTIDIYGKSTAYSSAADLYSSKADIQGTKLGSIVCGTSTELEITGDYEYIGIRSNSGAVYLNWIKIQWEDAKPEYNACFKDAGGNAVREVNATVGEEFTAPSLYVEGGLAPEVTYASSDGEVATVDAESGAVTLKKKGDAIITATLDGDANHKTTKVPYTLHVANVLSSIEITTEPTKKSYYVGDEADYSGIAVTAHYNDETTAEIAFKDLEFSGFDSSVAVAEQKITVSYEENDVTKSDYYNIEIVAATTLYEIDVTGAADGNGNSVTVEGSKVKAEEGDEITLNVNLNTGKGYKLTSLKFNGEEVSDKVAEGKYTFTMPAEAVTVTAEFDNHYTVTIEQPSANGTVKVQNATTSPQSIACGETVSVLAAPETGYELDSWTINGAELADATKASTTFTMPAKDVTITASFKKHIETQKITLTAADVTEFDSSYKEYAWSVNGVAGKMWAYRGGSSGSYNMQFNKTTYVKNTTAVPGRIKSITMTKVSGTDRTWSVYVGATALTSTTGATQVESAKEVSSETKWTVTSGDYYYFYLTKADGGTNIGSIVIEYEPGVVPAVDASWKVDPISVKAGADKDATIDTNYDGTLSVSSNNTGIATAKISGTTITVTGVKEGTTTLTVTGAATTNYNAINKTINVTVTAATTPALTYSFTISPSDFTTGGYAANNGDHNFTATCTTDPTKTMVVTCTTNQVYQNSDKMQWKKSEGYIYNKTNLGTIKSVTVNSTGGTFTTNYGTTEHPTSGTTVGNGYFTVKVGGATGYTTSIVVTFTAD